MLLTISSLISYIFLIDPGSFASTLHKFCADIFQESNLSDLNQALICGRSIRKSDFYISLSRAGLLHILVVSGYHLGIFHKILKCLKNYIWLPNGLAFILMSLYALMTNWQPPVVRSLIEIFLHKRTPQHFAIILSWVVAIILHPEWTNSLSLQLSLIARGAIFLTQSRSLFLKNLLITLSIFPLISYHNPLITFVTLVLSPILLFLLALNAAFEFFTQLFDHFTLIRLEKLCQHLIKFHFWALDQLAILFEPLNKKTLWFQNYSTKLLYVTSYLVIIYYFGTRKLQSELVTQPIKKEPRFGFWALFLFILIVIQPQRSA
jgi:hypothetical protein